MSSAKVEVAVISDVHGNRWALKAVLEDIEHRGIRDIVNLGDSLYGPLAPAETAEMLLPLVLSTVRGNEDRLIVEAVSGGANFPTLCYVQRQLRQRHLDWLASLQESAVAYEHFRAFHGAPGRDDEYLLREITKERVRLRAPERLTAILASVEQPVVLCGHDHVPRTVRLPDGKLIVNPGSVGLPAFADDLPYPHVMEAGTPHARYAIVRRTEGEWRAEHVAVGYDWESAATLACENGRPDWARWLRSGRASPGALDYPEGGRR